MPWIAEADVAERLQDGCIFIAGDAAHVMPPNGGFGGNTGVQDAQNLAWKLALVLDGGAEPDLLASYDPERRPVGYFTAEQAYARYVTRTAPYLGTDGMQPVEPELDVELGHCHHSTAVMTGDDLLHENPRASKGRPGTRAPTCGSIEAASGFPRWICSVAPGCCSPRLAQKHGVGLRARRRSICRCDSTCSGWARPGSRILTASSPTPMVWATMAPSSSGRMDLSPGVRRTLRTPRPRRSREC